MIRAFFFSAGLFVALCGGALVCIERVVLTDYASDGLRRHFPAGDDPPDDAASPAWRPRFAVARPDEAGLGREVIDPPDWAGFALASLGGLTLAYSLCLPGRRPTAGPPLELRHDGPHSGGGCAAERPCHAGCGH